jgi:hypothetical protein
VLATASEIKSEISSEVNTGTAQSCRKENIAFWLRNALLISAHPEFII